MTSDINLESSVKSFVVKYSDWRLKKGAYGSNYVKILREEKGNTYHLWIGIFDKSKTGNDSKNCY